MKKLIRRFMLVSLVAVLFIPACSDDSKDCGCTDENFSGQMLSISDCKSGLKSTKCNTSESCIEFSYNTSTGVLEITHLNAAFNCCPDSVSMTFSLRNDTIFITEVEEAALCFCDCLYDLNFSLNNIEAKEYIISFIEPYCGEQANLEVSINFGETISGTLCVDRTQYPWGAE